MKIVVAEKLGKAGIDMLAAQPGWEVVPPDEYTANPAEHLRDAEALIVRSAVQVTDAVLQGAPRLRVIGRAGVGVDNVDISSATRRGIIVMNTPGGNAVAVAELTIGLMLALARHIPRATEGLHAGRWEKKSLEGTELRGKTLGIAGFGRVGVEVARRAIAMGMAVIAVDPYAPAESARRIGVTLAGLDEVLARADYLTLHVGLTPQTQNLISREALSRMKPGVRIINCARGELVDEAALAEALRAGHVAGAALDVFRKEPLKESELMALPQVILTPHIAGSTVEAQEGIALQIAGQVREYLLHGVAQNAVNMPSVSDEEYEQMRPYLAAAQKTGSLLGQLFSGNLEQIHITYEGRVGEWPTALLRNATIAGVLQHGSQEKINYVNAAASAEERGVRVHERKSESEVPALRIAIAAGGQEMEARCAVVHGKSHRLLELKGVEIESELEGSLIVLENRDTPGVIGAVGALLGRHKINIARFSLGRAEAPLREYRRALAIIQTDSLPTPEVLNELKALPQILSVAAIVL